MPLTGKQKLALDAALQSAFPTFDDLERFTSYYLDWELRKTIAPAGMDTVVYQLVKQAQSRGRIDELVTAARLANPGSPELRDLVDSGVLSVGVVASALIRDPDDALAADLIAHGHLAAELPRGPALEAIVNRAAGFEDVLPWITSLLEQANRICRIEVVSSTSTTFGTGFLVGPDRVLTNHHVLAPLIDDGADTSGTRFRFGYRIRADKTIDPGTEFGVRPGGREAWLLAASPPSTLDLEPHPDGEPTTDELDFALVRLDGVPGEDSITGAGQRGWVDLSAISPQLEEDLPILILQHPKQLPLKLAPPDSVITVNAKRTRVTYRPNTLEGSSGSPCFTFGFGLVALHHAGDPAFEAGRNEGVPIETIVSKLRADGLVGAGV